MKQLEAEELRSSLPGGRTLFTYGKDWYAAFVLRYWNGRLRLSRQWWDEAMLSAAVDFIVSELGLRTIYYHSPVSGARLKGGGAHKAPTSLYTDLPRRFCFEKTTSIPSFIKHCRKQLAGLWMLRLCL